MVDAAPSESLSQLLDSGAGLAAIVMNIGSDPMS